jgi:serine/threonine-protein kinase
MSQTGNMGRGTIGELDPLIGRTISGRYRVHSLIGQGGMGKVFEAQQIPLGRSVALKVLSTTQTTATDTEFQQRFFHEAAILARLRSPHTVTVFDYGRDGDIFFIAMELVTGKAFDRLLREVGVLQPGHALSVGIQIARSLREAHALGVVHRDLKPANVLIARTADGEEHVKVLDFGLAKRLSVVEHEDTSRNVVPGSPKYMAPEVIRQEDVDGRADIYALGIMLYHMLVGRVPFDAENPLDILMAHLHNAPPPLAQVRPNARVPRELEALVMRCLEKKPEQRFANMQEVIDSLRAIGRTIGADGDMNGPMSIQPPTMSTASGNTMSPAPPVRSGGSNRPVTGNPRASEPVRLRLDNFEATPSGTQVKKSPIKRSLFLPIAIATACAVIGALLVWLMVGPREGATDVNQGGVTATPLPAPPEPAAPTPPPAAQAQPSAEEAPVMDFTDQVLEAPSAKPSAQTRAAARAALPTVMITARSVPAGAAVLVRGTRMGLTPLTFRFQDSLAKKGETIAVTFQLKGHASKTVRQTVGADTLLVDAVLVPEPSAVEEEAATDEEEESAEDALDDIEQRARELEAPEADSVLKITETP